MFSKPIISLPSKKFLVKTQMHKIRMFLKLHSDSAAVRAEVYFYECYSVPKTSPSLNPFATYMKGILL